MTSLARMHTVVVPGGHLMAALLGQRDANLRQIEAAFPDASLAVRGNEITVDGAAGRCRRPAVRGARRAAPARPGPRRVGGAPHDRHGPRRRAPERGAHRRRPARRQGPPVRPKTSGQKRYVDAIRENVITFGLGPAGTGKSWLAVAMAVQALQAQAGGAHHPHPAGGRGGGAARLPARRPDGQDRPVPAAAVRRPLRHGRARGRAEAARAAGRSRSPRWRSCAAAR